LPAGNCQLNFVGNGIIGNGRAVDVANNGTQIDAFREFEFMVEAVAGQPGDYDASGKVDGHDFLAWQRGLGQTVTPGTGADGNNKGTIDGADLGVWRDNFGLPASAVSATSAAAIDEALADLAGAANSFHATSPRAAAEPPAAGYRPGLSHGRAPIADGRAARGGD
jgi:hypothetical protein